MMGTLKTLIAGVVLIAIGYNLFFVYVEPDEYGIKVARVGINRGVSKKGLSGGPDLCSAFRAAADLSSAQGHPGAGTDQLSRHRCRSGKERPGGAHSNIGRLFRGCGRFLLYHIKDPYLVFTTIGPGTLFEDNGIIPKAEPALKETLGKLTTEEFYNSPLRVQKAEEAKQRLNSELNLKGIEVDQVLVRYFIYSKEIQKNIEEKKLQDQMVFTNQAAARAAKEEAELKKIVQEGMVIAAVELEKGKAYVTRKIAEKDYYVRKKKAEADLLVKLAEAERVRLKNEAVERNRLRAHGGTENGRRLQGA